MFRSAIFPSLHHRKGWLRPLIKMTRRLLSGRRRGGFPFLFKRKPPRPRDQRRLRDFFLIARPPLLAVMQGGEYACPKRFLIFSQVHRPRVHPRPAGAVNKFK